MTFISFLKNNRERQNKTYQKCDVGAALNNVWTLHVQCLCQILPFQISDTRKLKWFHISDLKLAGASAISPTLSLSFLLPGVLWPLSLCFCVNEQSAKDDVHGLNYGNYFAEQVWRTEKLCFLCFIFNFDIKFATSRIKLNCKWHNCIFLIFYSQIMR